MTKILELYFGHAPTEHAKRDAFEIGVSRIVDSRPVFTREALSDPDLLTIPDVDIGVDWRRTGDDLDSAIEPHRSK